MFETVRQRLGEGVDAASAGGDGIIVALIDTFPIAPRTEADSDPDPLGRIIAFRQSLGTSQSFHPWRLDQAAAGSIVQRGNVRNTYVDPPPHGIRACKHPAYSNQEPAVADHGLFVADIVKDIAPDAEVRVYRAFTDDGVSDLGTIAAAVSDAIREAGDNPLIINMSGGFGPQTAKVIELLENLEPDGSGRPTRDPRVLADDIQAAAPVPVNQVVAELRGKGLLERRWDGTFHFRRALAAIDDLFSRTGASTNVLAIAASGNDSNRYRWGNRRFGPRLPAAVQEVVGVSAFVPDAGAWRGAAYTDEDNLFAINEGIAAFGGDIDGGRGSDPNNAPVGLYVSSTYPDGSSNTTGWAAWSGTSFAAPVVAGFAACLWSAMRAKSGNVTGGAVRNLIFDPGGPQSGQVLQFEQGWP